jgi:hypothetical protein
LTNIVWTLAILTGYKAADAKAKLADAEAKAKELGKQTQKDVNSAIDKFDKNVVSVYARDIG